MNQTRWNSILPISLTWVAALVLSACSSGVKLDDNNKAAVETRTPSAIGTPAGGAGGAAGSETRVAHVDQSGGNAANALLSNVGRTVYFDYDSFVVKDEFRPVIEGHAKALSGNRTTKIAIEGHTDERGGREYNLALGQKRAEAGVKSLTLLGVSDAQLEAVSYGEERPAAQGADESTWAKNRRAELVRR